MSVVSDQLKWVEEKNSIGFNCELDLAYHPIDSKVILLIIPGVDGSVDGFENKYVRIAEDVQRKYGAAVFRMSNPFISSYFWESNIRRALEYIQKNCSEIVGTKDYELRIVGHSAGAAVIASIAWEYPMITKLLLINPAMKMDIHQMKRGAKEFGTEKITMLIGGNDPSIQQAREFSEQLGIKTIYVDGADHNFSGEAFQTFLDAPSKYLFDDEN
jgi:predicted esterase